MTVDISPRLTEVARALDLSEADLLERGTRVLLEQRLRQVKAEIFRICGRHRVSSVAEMEARYRDGTLDESDSWRDLQDLDHLEFERDRLNQLLESLK